MDSSSKHLLEILRKLEYDGESYNNISASRLASDFYNVDNYLKHQWEIVDDFFDKINAALEENLRVVRSELEIYSQSSIAIEEELATVVREVNDKAVELLKNLNII